MTGPNPSRTRRRRWSLIAITLGMATVGVGALVAARNGPTPPDVAGGPTYVVQRGPLTIGVTESGTIQAREQHVLQNEVEGQTTIISLVPEGTMVERGDLLVELDASRLEDESVEQQIKVQNAEAAYVRARENVEVVRSLGESNVATAEQDYRFAQEDLTQYVEGQYPTDLKAAQAKITLAKEELERASEKLAWSQKLHDEKYLSQTELEADRLTRNRAQLDYELAVSARDLLRDFDHERKVAELKSRIVETRMALDRARRVARADLVQSAAELKAKELEHQQQRAKLAKLEEQIAKTKIYAPADGMVIHATSAQRGGWRGNAEPLDEGQTVRERQELIHLPTTDSAMAEVKLHESHLNKVRVGLPVRVTVDALPGRVFTGRVARIAPLPDAQSMWLNPDLKVYTTEIHLDGSGQGLRSGMSCQAEIIIDRYQDATYVPVQAVTRVGGQPIVHVARGDRLEARPVEIGLDNNRMVRILSGLEPGETVLLTPPLGAPGMDTPDGPTDVAGRGDDVPADGRPPNPGGGTAPSVGAGGRDGASGSGTGGSWRDLSPEERRKRLEALSPEERRRLGERYRQRQQSPPAAGPIPASR